MTNNGLQMKRDLRRLQELSGIVLEFASEDAIKRDQPDVVIWATIDFGPQAKFAFGAATDPNTIRNIMLNIQDNEHIVRELRGDLSMLEYEATNCIDEVRYGNDQSIAREHAVLKHGMSLLKALRAKGNSGAELIKEVILADPGENGAGRNTELEYIAMFHDPKGVIPAVETRSLYWSGDQDYHLFNKK